MAWCAFCGEWAGAGSNRHAECAREFQREMQRPSLTRRLFSAIRRAANTIIALIAGSVDRAS